jgi:hypothetical protein
LYKNVAAVKRHSIRDLILQTSSGKQYETYTD